jgi:polysaccharide deacetylase family protein (PEP-CTERM system associated)
MTESRTHLLTFDVEHWYESYRHRNLSGWENIHASDHLIVEKIFELLSKYQQTATFFFTGRFAKEFPHVVIKCLEHGHEVASHSYDHKVIYRMKNEDEFRKDLLTSIEILGNLIGKPILGYRAPKWSITAQNQEWVFDVLLDAGLIYDSSFFPSPKADIYRNLGQPIEVLVNSGRSIIEIPATGYNLKSLTIPVGGGLYFRAFPAWVTSMMLAQKELKEQEGMIYVHPYDLNIDNPQVSGGSLLFKMFRTYGVAGAWAKLEKILAKHRFTSIEQKLPTLNVNLVLNLRKNHG